MLQATLCLCECRPQLFPVADNSVLSAAEVFSSKHTRQIVMLLHVKHVAWLVYFCCFFSLTRSSTPTWNHTEISNELLTFSSYFLPLMHSGAIQKGEPTTFSGLLLAFLEISKPQQQLVYSWSISEVCSYYSASHVFPDSCLYRCNIFHLLKISISQWKVLENMTAHSGSGIFAARPKSPTTAVNWSPSFLIRIFWNYTNTKDQYLGMSFCLSEYQTATYRLLLYYVSVPRPNRAPSIYFHFPAARASTLPMTSINYHVLVQGSVYAPGMIHSGRPPYGLPVTQKVLQTHWLANSSVQSSQMVAVILVYVDRMGSAFPVVSMGYTNTTCTAVVNTHHMDATCGKAECHTVGRLSATGRNGSAEQAGGGDGLASLPAPRHQNSWAF